MIFTMAAMASGIKPFPQYGRARTYPKLARCPLRPILAEGDKCPGGLDGSVRNPFNVASHFTVLRVCLEYAFRIRRNREAQKEP